MNGSKDTSAEHLIEQAGGSAALSRLTGYSVQRINNWKQRGIPAAAKVRFPHLFWPDRELGEQQVAPVLRPIRPPLKARCHAKRHDGLTVHLTLMQRIHKRKDQAMSQQNHPETAAQKLSLADADAIKAALVDCAARQMERGIYSPSELREVEDGLVAAFLRINSQASL